MLLATQDLLCADFLMVEIWFGITGNVKVKIKPLDMEMI